jgi:hypothetical protein
MLIITENELYQLHSVIQRISLIQECSSHATQLTLSGEQLSITLASLNIDLEQIHAAIIQRHAQSHTSEPTT